MSNKVIRRVRATDPVVVGERWDYTDAFEAELPESARRPATVWMRAGLEATPAFVKRVVEGLGMRRPGTLDADEAAQADADVVYLEMTLPLMRVCLIGRNTTSTRRVLTTALEYRRPVLAWLMWTLIGPLHRRTARRLVGNEAS